MSSPSQHHSYRSFLGLTCLMQISTRDQDYIIDTLELRSELYLLNEVFTDPAIVKVTHPGDATTTVLTPAHSHVLVAHEIDLPSAYMTQAYMNM